MTYQGVSEPNVKKNSIDVLEELVSVSLRRCSSRQAELNGENSKLYHINIQPVHIPKIQFVQVDLPHAFTMPHYRDMNMGEATAVELVIHFALCLTMLASGDNTVIVLSRALRSFVAAPI
ncbi:unnamed protein product [Fusarium graminearum]|uniref:Uncharacterized protein n=1 Tax=Gibberella zeae TaxID=5518 RepID=A0A4E9D0I1_GIBZA|nr:unnamed protein product [Fusarium graminearum]CAF3493217.1 unnamed protein product [Fusarium graminearum]CAG1966388.1 unnamed protein product [Fusarium graminearum]CAG1976691.1 unnamed protein product [Fusarium graminearum]